MNGMESVVQDVEIKRNSFLEEQDQVNETNNLGCNKNNKNLNSSYETEDQTDSDLNQSQPLINKRSKLLKNNQNRLKNLAIYSFDILLSLFLFGPLVSFYWNFTWEYLDYFFLVNSPRISNFLCWILGLVIVFPSYLFQKDLQKLNNYLTELNFIWTNFLKVMLRTVYIYFVSFGVVMQWRGLWNLVDIYFLKDWKSQLSLAILCIAFLCLTRATKTLISNPFILYRDDYENFFTTESKHKFKIPDYPQFSFDFFLCELVECLALTCAWKGIDNLYYTFLFPQDKMNSLLFSFLLSHAAYFLIVFIQGIFFNFFSNKTLIPRLIVEDCFNIGMFFSAILYWKFYWDIMDLYLFNQFDNYLFEMCIAGHFVSFLIAVIFKTTGLLVGPGTKLLDGEANEDLDSYLDIEFINSIHKIQVDAIENERNRIQIQGLV